MKHIVSFFFVFLSIGLSLATGQQVWTPYSTANSPLPENSVRCISIDHQGRKWIGTDYGLAVFDDLNWTVYLPFTSGLPGLSVRAIAFDSINNAWIGTLGGGLAKFDGNNWTIYDDSNSPLTDNFIRSLAFDSSGALWIGNQDGLVKMDGSNWQIYSSANSIIQNTIASIHTTGNNKVYAGSVNGGLFILHDDTIKANLTISNGSGIPDNTILAFDEDTVGNIWMATPANGIVVYRNIGGWFWYYMGNSFIQSNSLSDIQFNHSQTALWLATSDSGIIRRNGVQYTCFNTVNSAIPDNNIQCLTIDSSNTIWIGTATQGVVKLQDYTGLNNTPSEYAVTFPNPANERIYFKSIKAVQKIDLRFTDGRLAKTVNCSLSSTSIDISDLNPGMYMMTIYTADAMLTEKIVKR
jgi:ligand-binding sensor domain-containing protein